jgi:brevianamide F synthase
LYDLASNFQAITTLSTQIIPSFSLLDEQRRQTISAIAMEQCGIPIDQIDDIYPCTALQEGLMALTAKEVGMYTAQLVYHLTPDVDLNQLKAAWQATVDANVILRTRIIQTESDGLFQVVGRDQINWIQGDSITAYLADDIAKPMSLGQPLVRFAIIQSVESNQPLSMVLTLHHALYDGWSLNMLFSQVDAAYYGQQLELRKFNQFIQYITHQDLSSTRDFWISEFTDLHASVFPPLYTAMQSLNPSRSVERDISIILERSSNITLSNIIRLAWAIVISCYTDSDDVVFGVTVSGRGAAVHNIEELTGPTIATLPFRVQVQADESVQAALEVIQMHATRMIPFEQTGLQHIRQMSDEAASASNFQSLLAVQIPRETYHQSQLMLLQNSYSDYKAFASYAFVLVCNLTTQNNLVNVTANFDPDIIEPGQAGHLVSQFTHVLQQLCTHPEQQIQEVEVISPEDIEQLHKWNSPWPRSCSPQYRRTDRPNYCHTSIPSASAGR